MLLCSSCNKSQQALGVAPGKTHALGVRVNCEPPAFSLLAMLSKPLVKCDFLSHRHGKTVFLGASPLPFSRGKSNRCNSIRARVKVAP